MIVNSKLLNTVNEKLGAHFCAAPCRLDNIMFFQSLVARARILLPIVQIKSTVFVKIIIVLIL